MGIRKTIDIAHIAVTLLLVSLVGNILPCTCTAIDQRVLYKHQHQHQHQHHVVGGDQGWDAFTDLASWSTANNKFHVGDIIWFTYAAPQEGVIELKTKREFESCKASNPIKMYTEGLNQVPLQSEGSRYFISANPENCKKGLKLHVKVLPLPVMQQIEQATGDTSYSVLQVLAQAPSTSATKCYKGCFSLVTLCGLLWLFFFLV